MEVVSSLIIQDLVSVRMEPGEQQEDERKRVGDGLRALGAMKMMFNVESVSFGMKRALYEILIVPTVIYGAET